MSTKIHNGKIIKAKNLSKTIEFYDNFCTVIVADTIYKLFVEMQNTVGKEYQDWKIAQLLKKADGNQEWTEQIKKSEKDGVFLYDLAMAMIVDKTRSHQHGMANIGSWINFFADGDDVLFWYGLPGETRSIKWPSYVRDFSYENQTDDVPKGLTYEEYQARGERWDRVTNSNHKLSLSFYGAESRQDCWDTQIMKAMRIVFKRLGHDTSTHEIEDRVVQLCLRAYYLLDNKEINKNFDQFRKYYKIY